MIFDEDEDEDDDFCCEWIAEVSWMFESTHHCECDRIVSVAKQVARLHPGTSPTDPASICWSTKDCDPFKKCVSCSALGCVSVTTIGNARDPLGPTHSWQVSVRLSCSSVTAVRWCTASVPAGGADLNSISSSAPQNCFFRELSEVHDLCATR